MKVLVVATNRAIEPYPVMPYGACLIAEAAERAGHDVALLDLMFEKGPLPSLRHRLRESRPQVVAFSVRNIDNNDMLSPRALYRGLRELVTLVREESAATTIIGGPAVAIMPRALLAYSGADWASRGDGEVLFPKLLSALERGNPMSAVPGLARLDHSGYDETPVEHTVLGEAPPVPDYGRWLRLGDYRAALVPAPLQTKRGCPYTCIYCAYTANEGRAFRLYPPARVAEAVGRLAARGLRDIEFVDNVFNSPPEHAIEVCEEIRRRGVRARLDTINLNPQFIDDELLIAMEHAGFAAMGVSAESASDPVLEGLAKNFRAADLDRAAGAVARRHIPCLWVFLVGGPGETESTLAETLDFAQRRVRRCDAAFFTFGIRIYPGTPLEKVALAQGVIDRPAEDMLDPVFYLAPGLSEAKVVGMLRAAVRRNLNFTNAAACAHPLLPTLTKAASWLNCRPPLWRHTAALRRLLRLVGRDIA